LRPGDVGSDFEPTFSVVSILPAALLVYGYRTWNYSVLWTLRHRR